MAIRDTEAFLRQRAALFDPNADVSPGSPFDVQIIQPMVRRLGTDPFTVDLPTFVSERLMQAFPDLATKEGDALTDLLVKPATLLWDPIVREIRRVQRTLSFKDPSTQTREEAESLGANFFSRLRRGDFSRGVGRIFFTQPQNISISPVNFFTSKGGLHFFPTDIQSIRTEEMVLNLSSEGLYFFDINVIAEAPGTQYDIGPNELASIANVPSAVRVTNPRRFGFGQQEETASQYISRTEQELSERSLVTLRGIAAKILNSFPEVTRLNVVGFNDPEMQRDIITGGGIGPIAASGIAGSAIADTEGKDKTRRFFSSEVNFITAIDGSPSGWVLTVFGATGPVVPAIDLTVREIIAANEVDVVEQELIQGTTALRWTLRQKELTLSGIPGGILFPDSASGTVAVPDGTVHIGGAYDLYLRSSGFEEATLIVENTTDDSPLFAGNELEIATVGPETVIQLNEFVLNVDYVDGDETFKTFEKADVLFYTLQILEGVDAGTYRILRVTQASGQPVELLVEPTPTNPGATLYRWRLFDQIDIDFIEPKETRIEGEDLRTVQGSDIVDTVAGINFNDFGVAEGDVLRILNGPDAGDYTLLQDPLAPSFDDLQVDRPLTQSESNLEYLIFRPNEAGGVVRPLVRIKSIELLDSSSQPIGSTIPYAKPVDIQSRAFQNPARGTKHDFRDARLGLMTVETAGGVFPVTAGQTLAFEVNSAAFVILLTVTNPTQSQLIADLNSLLLAATTISQMAVAVGPNRVGIRAVRGGVIVSGGTAMTALFGTDFPFSSSDVRSDTVSNEGGWDDLEPLIDFTPRLDVLQVLDGNNVGFYEAPFRLRGGVTQDRALVPSGISTPGAEFHGFAPEIDRRVQIGARSLGSARVFFLEPTSFEVDGDTRFMFENENGTLLFLPDPTLDYQKIPALPSGAQSQDGSSTGLGVTFTSASQDFIRSGIQRSDKLVIENHYIAGTAVLADPVVGLVNTTFIFSLDGGPNRTLTFIRDDISLNPTEVSRLGVVDQINAAAGETIVELTGTNTLQFTTPRDLVVRKDGTSNSLILGDVAGTSPVESFVTDDQDNASPHSGTYSITTVNTTSVTVSGVFPSSAPFSDPVVNQSFKVLESGTQRINTTAMADNQAEAGLFFFDVELVSEGAGDAWNIDADNQMTAADFRSDGYFLVTDDANLTFSVVEEVKLILSRTMLENGVDDDPQNATQLSGQNLQITYERAGLVADAQGFISSDVERVVCSSPLSRHLIPHFVRFDLRYTGGSKESVVVPEIEQLIRDLPPIEALESSDIQKVVLDRGATGIDNPIDLIAIVHYPDRTIYAARSQNSLSTGRLAAFIPDRLDIQRNVT